MVIKYCVVCGNEEDFSNKQSFCSKDNPRTFCKNINNKYKKISGIDSKNEFDSNKFKERYNQILNISIGKEITIEEIREEGSYGTEYRDALNYSVCKGLIKKYQQKRKSPKTNQLRYYEVFERIDGKGCINYFFDEKKNKVSCKCDLFIEKKVLDNE